MEAGVVEPQGEQVAMAPPRATFKKAVRSRYLFAGPPRGQCDACARFFARYRCNGPASGQIGECDCPRCQGYCKCDGRNN